MCGVSVSNIYSDRVFPRSAIMSMASLLLRLCPSLHCPPSSSSPAKIDVFKRSQSLVRVSTSAGLSAFPSSLQFCSGSRLIHGRTFSSAGPTGSSSPASGVPFSQGSGVGSSGGTPASGGQGGLQNPQPSSPNPPPPQEKPRNYTRHCTEEAKERGKKLVAESAACAVIEKYLGPWPGFPPRDPKIDEYLDSLPENAACIAIDKYFGPYKPLFPNLKRPDPNEKQEFRPPPRRRNRPSAYSYASRPPYTPAPSPASPTGSSPPGASTASPATGGSTTAPGGPTQGHNVPPGSPSQSRNSAPFHPSQNVNGPTGASAPASPVQVYGGPSSGQVHSAASGSQNDAGQYGAPRGQPFPSGAPNSTGPATDPQSTAAYYQRTFNTGAGAGNAGQHSINPGGSGSPGNFSAPGQ